MAYFQLAAFLLPFIFAGADFLVLVYMLPGLVDEFCDVFGKTQPPKIRVKNRGIGVTRDTKLVA
ncbi:hypothetical protein [Oribacterium sp. FC2011]|uniref:hypothetical protein n=1 Tax=Oribacterium sp. FC2011 TaxID=1408311 RepID=UPI0004E27F3F|nr:hypothetical protein [Oribacterium sp. FC2011]